jgi:hypothetical protein
MQQARVGRGWGLVGGALALWMGAGCLLSGLGGTDARFVDELDEDADPEWRRLADQGEGEECGFTDNCVEGLRCVERRGRSFCALQCDSDFDCESDECRPVSNAFSGWCAVEELDELDDAPDDGDPTEDDGGDPPSAEPVAGGGCGQGREAEQLDALNADRAASGLAPVCCHGGLAEVARAHSADMGAREFFDHTNPDGQSPWDRMTEAEVQGWEFAGENIAYGYDSAQGVQEAWMDSPGHRANILEPGFTHVGVGAVADEEGVLYWTQLFASFPDLPCR